MRNSMTAQERRDKLAEVEKMLGGNVSITAACMRARVTKAWYRRWTKRREKAIDKALTDCPRSGRPTVISDDVKLSLTLSAIEKEIKTVEQTTNALKSNVEQVKKRIFGPKSRPRHETP